MASDLRRSGAWRRFLAPLGCLLLGGCELQDAALVSRAPPMIVGLSANDLRLCAGLPDRTGTGTDDAQFWSYERSATTGTGSLTLSQIGFSLADAQECRMTVELVRDRVSRVAFTRVVGSSTAPSAACAPLLETCVEMVQAAQLIRTAPPP